MAPSRRDQLQARYLARLVRKSGDRALLLKVREAVRARDLTEAIRLMGTEVCRCGAPRVAHHDTTTPSSPFAYMNGCQGFTPARRDP